MNAPHTPEQPINQLRILPLDMLDASKTNPRKRFDEAKLNELAESIKTQGVLQPILVREITWPIVRPKSSWPFPEPGKPTASVNAPGEPSGRYEVIAGERRYRAAKLAGLKEVPCFVRNLTDLQVLHAQVIENLQRDDLHPIEEAEGYERLMQEKDADGKAYTADSIAAEVGKSRAYVYARLKLLALCHEAREAFYKDELDASTALLIARIPVNKLQIEAVKKVTEKAQYDTSTHREGDVLMSYRAARDYIQDTFMLDLDKAPFDTKDAALLAKAGACADCTKRTGNQPELFDDVKSKDVCTDTVCFGMKKAAHVLAIQKEAEEKGHQIILGKAAKKLLPYPYNPAHQLDKAGLAPLDAKIPDDEKGRTWAQALKSKKLLDPTKDTGKSAVQKTLVENPHEGGLIETISIEAATKALREAGFEIRPIEVAKKQSDADKKKEQEKYEAKIKLKVEQTNAYRLRLFNTLRQQIVSDTTGPKAYVAPGIYRIMAERMFDGLEMDYDDSERIARLHMPNAPAELEGDELFEELKKLIPTMTAQQHFLLMVDTIMIGESETSRWTYNDSPTTMLAIAAELGIDAAAIEKEAVSEFKAAQKAAKKSAETDPPATPAAPAVGKTPKKTKAAQAPEATA